MSIERRIGLDANQRFEGLLNGMWKASWVKNIGTNVSDDGTLVNLASYVLKVDSYRSALMT